MDRVDIPAWVAAQRATAKTQLERWQGVDPSRLLEALDLIEQLLAENSSDGAEGISLNLLGVRAFHRPAGFLFSARNEVELRVVPIVQTIDEEMEVIRRLFSLSAPYYAGAVSEVLIIPRKP